VVCVVARTHLAVAAPGEWRRGVCFGRAFGGASFPAGGGPLRKETTEPGVTAETSPQGVEGEAFASRFRRFGAFEMDLQSMELRKNGVAVRLQPQPFRLLALLTERPGGMVTREEMREKLWPDGTLVAFEQSLNFCIRQVRLALNDSALTPRFVETLPRRGYRWVGGPVTSSPGAGPGEGRQLGADDLGREPKSGGRGASSRNGASRRRGWLWVLLVPALAALAFIGDSVLRRASSTQHFRRVTFRRGFVTGARFGPDGQVIYAASWEGRPLGLYETRVDSPDTRSLEQDAIGLAGVSASGEVAFIRDGALVLAPLAGGPAREVATDVAAADWAADASTFALARAVENGHQLEYPIGRALCRAPGVADLRISPDGRHVAFSEHPTLGDDRGRVVVIDQEGHRVAASETFGSLEGVAWSPRGDEVWFTAVVVGVKNSLRALSLESRERVLLGSMDRLVLHDVAADGRLLISRAALRAEILFQRADAPEPVDLSWLDVSAVADLSPDGDTILFYEGGDGGGPDYTTYLRRTDGSPPVRLGHGRAVDLSPDGRWALIIPVTRPDHMALVPTGAGQVRELRGPGGMVTHDTAGWLSDGRTLFVTGRDDAGRRSTWLTDASGRHPRRLPLPEGRSLARNTFSPDNAVFVAGCPVPDERPCLYDADQGHPRPVPGAEATWEAIGWDEEGRILFRDRPRVGTMVRLRRVDPATGDVVVLADLEPRDPAGVLSIYRAFVTPDAGAWAFTVTRRQSDLFVVTGVD
jgi:DNA-binding winged helix-turn-helix (wHTH) protein